MRTETGVASSPSVNAAEMLRITPDEFAGRTTRLRAKLREKDVDALIAFASRAEHGDVRYLTGFEPWLIPEQWAVAVVLQDATSEVSLITNSPWNFAWPEFAPKLWINDIVLPRPRQDASGVADSSVLPPWMGIDWADPILERLPTQARRVAVAGWHSFPTPLFRELTTRAPRLTFSDGTGLLRELRMIKTTGEVALLRFAGTIADAAGRAFFEAVGPGVTEREVCAAVDAAMMCAGTEQLAYWTNLAAGRRTLVSCFLPTERMLKDGDIVQLDCGPMVDGYKADFSRVIVVGTGSPLADRLVETVASAYSECAAALKPGVECADIARTGLRVVRANGYGDENMYLSPYDPQLLFMGHGIGLENPDPPGMLSLKNHAVLEEGMVINLEPILLDAEVGAGRIESAFVITARGATPLSATNIRPRKPEQ